MTKEKNIIRLGKHLALLLKHDNEAFCDGRNGSIGQMIFFSVEGGNVALTDC